MTFPQTSSQRAIDISKFIVLALTDADTTGGLLGIRV